MIEAYLGHGMAARLRAAAGRAMKALLDVSGLRGGYGAVEVLRGVDLRVGEGEASPCWAATARARARSTTWCPAIVPAWAGRVRLRWRGPDAGATTATWSRPA